jgi:glycosyltransferase involved in cell wall biosynthesis
MYLSVIMPVLNGERYIEEALDSVFGQGISPIEMIVVDDGSTDNTASILSARSEPIKVLTTDRAGPAAAKNEGLRIATGDLIAFLDSDDLWTDGTLSKLLHELHASPEREIVMGRCKYLVMPDAGDEHLKTQFDDDSLYGVTLGAGLYRRSVFDKVGLFNEDLRFSEDVDWLMRVREEKCNLRLVDFVSLIYRRHGNNMTRDKNVRDLGAAKVLKMSLERRRKKGLAGRSMAKMSEHLGDDKKH